MFYTCIPVRILRFFLFLRFSIPAIQRGLKDMIKSNWVLVPPSAELFSVTLASLHGWSGKAPWARQSCTAQIAGPPIGGGLLLILPEVWRTAGSTLQMMSPEVEEMADADLLELALEIWEWSDETQFRHNLFPDSILAMGSRTRAGLPNTKATTGSLFQGHKAYHGRWRRSKSKPPAHHHQGQDGRRSLDQSSFTKTRHNDDYETNPTMLILNTGGARHPPPLPHPRPETEGRGPERWRSFYSQSLELSRARRCLVLNFFFKLLIFSSHQNFSIHINFQRFYYIVIISTKLLIFV